MEGNDGWVEWHGGECPVAGNVMVEIKCRPIGNVGMEVKCSAGSWYWEHRGGENDIIAYRIVAESKPEPKPRQHVSDKAWEAYARTFVPGPDDDRSNLEEDARESGYMLVTCEEWDAHSDIDKWEQRDINYALGKELAALREQLDRKLNPPPYPPKLKAAEDELAALREQLAEKDKRIAYLEATTNAGLCQAEVAQKWVRELLAELERLRKTMSLPYTRRGDTEQSVAERHAGNSGALLTIAPLDARLGGDQAR